MFLSDAQGFGLLIRKVSLNKVPHKRKEVVRYCLICYEWNQGDDFLQGALMNYVAWNVCSKISLWPQVQWSHLLRRWYGLWGVPGPFPQSPASHCALSQSLFQTGWPLIHWTRLIGWRGSICFIEGCQVKAVTLSLNQLFIGSYLVFNLAAVYGIRLMAVKWLRHKHGPSAEKALGHCLFERLRKKDEWETQLHWELHHVPVYDPSDLISLNACDFHGSILKS